MTDNRPPLRIGHEERNAAIKALDEHLSAGRLDPDEYGERMAAASMARTRDELDTLFGDLPEPHPFPQRPGWVASSWRPPVTSSYPQPARRRVPVAVAAAAIVAAMPFIALMLFILTKTWIFFLLVPAFGAIFSNRRGRRRGHYRAGRGPWGC